MNHTPDWSQFDEALREIGPRLLRGIDDTDRELIEMLAVTTDTFWSDGLEATLTEHAVDGDLRAGVVATLDVWRENVIDALATSFGIELDWLATTVDTTSPLIDELVVAANTPEV